MSLIDIRLTPHSIRKMHQFIAVLAIRGEQSHTRARKRICHSTYGEATRSFIVMGTVHRFMSFAVYVDANTRTNLLFYRLYIYGMLIYIHNTVYFITV